MIEERRRITEPADAWRRLPWDTDFFGIPIGTVDLTGLDDDTIRAVDADARAAGIRCLYGSLDSDEGQRLTDVQDLGYRFVDAATTFDLQLSEPEIPLPEGVTTRVGTVDDVEQVDPIAVRMADWSRFAADPRFGLEQAERLQRAWLDRAVDPGAVDHSLLVAEVDGEIVAFIGWISEPRPRVDAVGTTRRGSGAARRLIQEARIMAGDQPLLGGPIAARNVAALRYVSHCAYRVCEVRYLYHRWLDD